MARSPRPRFIYNLSKITFNDFVLKALRPRGYLLAPQNSSPGFLALVKAVTKKRRQLFLDNGNFANIGLVNSQLTEQAEKLKQEILQLRLKLGRFPRPADIPAELQTAYQELAFKAQTKSQLLTPTDDVLLQNQLLFNPDCLIGVEDITMASWLSLDIEPEYTQFPRQLYRKQNQAVARRAVKALKSDIPKHHQESYYPVASAVSYDTAFDAGKVFARAGLERISMGFGAYMADRNFTDHLFIGGKRHDLDGGVPMRYARTILVVQGFWDGYIQAAGVPPTAFHFLGLGAPIMLPLVTLCAHQTRDISFDATSPIRDAMLRGTLYVTKPAYLKVNTRKVAFRMASDTERRWDCPCPFCADFVNRHPFRYPLGHRWFKQEKGRAVEASDLQPGGGLFAAYPLFAEPTGGKVRQEVNFARIGHNHWALERIITSVRRASRDGRLQTRVTNIVKGYSQYTSKVFARALKLSLALATTGTLNN